MGLFNKKESVPELPSAPGLPKLPKMENSQENNLPELPSFPPNPKNESLNQEMVKSAVNDPAEQLAAEVTNSAIP